ncbi:hypothetical protein P1P70_44845, partial [Streptomyces sp. MB09-02B]|nr:hypothetical protein [Streptomyces sp. MB09-02B]
MNPLRWTAGLYSRCLPPARLDGLLRESGGAQGGPQGKAAARVIDAQSAKTSTSAAAASQGTDAAKKTTRPKPSIVPGPVRVVFSATGAERTVPDSSRHELFLAVRECL